MKRFFHIAAFVVCFTIPAPLALLLNNGRGQWSCVDKVSGNSTLTVTGFSIKISEAGEDRTNLLAPAFFVADYLAPAQLFVRFNSRGSDSFLYRRLEYFPLLALPPPNPS